MNKRLIIIIVIALAVSAGTYFLVFRSYCETADPISSVSKSPQEVFPGVDNVNCKNYFKAFLMLFNAGPKNAERISPSTSFGTKIDTSTWQTYRNEKFGYEFQYPKEWRLSLGPGEMENYEADLTLVKEKPGKEEPGNISQYVIIVRYLTPQGLNLMGVSYCEAYQDDSKRCEPRVVDNIATFIDLGIPTKWGDYIANLKVLHPNGGAVLFTLRPVQDDTINVFNILLSTFKFTK